MTRTFTSLLVRTRLPVEAWALAGLVTLFSLVCSLVQAPTANHGKPNVEQAIEQAKPPHRARV
jgi:hypothetical protein